MRPQKLHCASRFVHREDRRAAVAIRNMAAKKFHPWILHLVRRRRADVPVEIREAVIPVVEYGKPQVLRVFTIKEIRVVLCEKPICRRRGVEREITLISESPHHVSFAASI